MLYNFPNKYPIPDKFPQILHDYVREVIRNQPKDILDFSIKYFYSIENKMLRNQSSLTNKRSTINTELNINLDETNQDANAQSNTIQFKDNIYTSRINEMEKEESKINNSNESVEEDNDDNNENVIIEPELIVPISKEMEELIKKREEEEEKEQNNTSRYEKRPPSVISGISDNNSQKQDVKDFVSDLFNDNE